MPTIFAAAAIDGGTGEPVQAELTFVIVTFACAASVMFAHIHSVACVPARGW